MATVVKLLSALLLISVLATGHGQLCNLSSVQVQQTNPGLKAGYDTLFEVEIKNPCRCTATKVSLSSLGFTNSIPVNPKLFRLENSKDIVNDEKVSIKFSYAWDHYFRMSPTSF